MGVESYFSVFAVEKIDILQLWMRMLVITLLLVIMMTSPFFLFSSIEVKKPSCSSFRSRWWCNIVHYACADCRGREEGFFLSNAAFIPAKPMLSWTTFWATNIHSDHFFPRPIFTRSPSVSFVWILIRTNIWIYSFQENDTNEYPNIFVWLFFARTNIRIYSY